MKNYTVIEARKMTERKLETEIGKCSLKLETIGMSHAEACQFVATVMSLGIAIQEKKK